MTYVCSACRQAWTWGHRCPSRDAFEAALRALEARVARLEEGRRPVFDKRVYMRDYMRRRRAGIGKTDVIADSPWEAEGVSRATYYRRKRKSVDGLASGLTASPD